MHAKDPLHFFEAAYAFDRNEEAWVAGLAKALLPYNLGGGVAVYVSTFGETNRVRSFAAEELLFPRASIELIARNAPVPLYRRVHAPFPASFSQDAWPRAARQIGISLRDALAGISSETPPAAWAISGGDARKETVLAVFHCTVREDLRARDQHLLDCFAAHLGSALRLRSLLDRAPMADDREVDAVLAPDGKLLHLRKKASVEKASLIDAVRKSERAKLRGATPEERVDFWRALVEGRWSILEQVDRDGKRMLLACANEPATVRLRALTPRERAVAQLAGLGHSHKYIAYELGISVQTVGTHVKSAMRKLGLRTRVDLVKLFAKY